MLTPSGKPRTFVVPGWIYRAILRNKLNLNDIVNYEKISKILSQDDLVSWLYLNDRYQVGKHKLTPYALNNLFHGLTAEQTQTLDWLTYQSTTDAEALSVQERLRDVNNMTSTDLYQIVTVNDLVLIILNEGFQTAVGDFGELKKFITTYLKALYSLEPIQDVSQYPLYTLYLELL